MDGTFTATGSIYSASDPSTYIVGGKGREGQLHIGSEAVGTVALIVSVDGGSNWEDEGVYDSGDVKFVRFPDPNARYTLDCRTRADDFTYSMNSF